MKNNKYLKPKAIIKGKKVELTEQADVGSDSAYFMYENLEDRACTITQRFTLDGWQLVEPSGEAGSKEWIITLAAGSAVVKRMVVAELEKPKNGKKKGGGAAMMMGAMGGLADVYEQLERSYKITESKVELAEDEA